MEIVTESSIIEETKKINKPLLYQQGYYPLELITDREFEILIYYLFKNEKVFKSKEFDSINLMSGVAEKGRDSVLYKDDKVCGIIQCKHSKKNKKFNKTEVIMEIIKFILNCINTPEIINEIEGLKYYIIHSEGFYEPAQELLTRFNTKIHDEELSKYAKEIIEKNSRLNLIYDDSLKEKIVEFLNKLNVIKLEYADIAEMLSQNTHIIDIFFQIKKVEIIKPDIPIAYENREIDSGIKANYINKRFVEKLTEINLDKSDKDDAIKDYWNMAETLIQLNQNDYQDTDVIECYKNDLCTHYKLTYKNECEEIELGTSEKKVNKESRKFYRTIIGIDPKKIINYNNNRPFFQRGMFHSLVDDNRIATWKLVSYEEEDNN